MATDPTGIQISLFKDLYEAIRSVATDVRGLAGIPEAKRRDLLKAISESYAILNMATSLVATRLGKVLETGTFATKEAFAHQLASLQLFEEWYQIEHDASLCSAMRARRREMSKALTGVIARKSVRDWPSVQRNMDEVLGNESKLAMHITSTLESLSKLAPGVMSSKAKVKEAIGAVADARDELLAERREMIRDELALSDAIY
jgi:hypothetical protein